MTRKTVIRRLKVHDSEGRYYDCSKGMFGPLENATQYKDSGEANCVRNYLQTLVSGLMLVLGSVDEPE